VEEALARAATLQAQQAQYEKELTTLRNSAKSMEARLAIRTAAIASLSKEKTTLGEQLKKMTAELEKYQKQGWKSGPQDDPLAACQAALQVAEKKNSKLKFWLETRGMRLAKPQANLAGVTQEAELLAPLQEKLHQAELEREQLKDQLATAKESSERLKLKMTRELESAKAQVIGLEKIIEEKDASIAGNEKELERFKVNMDVLLARISDQENSLQGLQGKNRELAKDLAAKNAEVADLQDKLISMPVR
jgi:chromosome segregation ATPase